MAANNDENEMQRILQDLGMAEDVRVKFRREKITKSVVRDLSKSELEELGVTLLGDQKRLRSACTPPPTSSAIVDEVRRVMGYTQSRGNHSTTQPGTSGLNFDPHYIVSRRSSRASSSSRRMSGSTPGPAKKNPVVKNLTIIAYHKNCPRQFSTREATFILSGLIEIQPNLSEEGIRSAISSTITNSEVECIDTSKYGPNDFEFVKRSGHTFRVPECAPGFQFNADALKTLAGQGDVYVRLTKDVPKQMSERNHEANSGWSDDSDFETPMPLPSTPSNLKKARVSLDTSDKDDDVVYVPETPPPRSPESPSNSPASKKPKCNETCSSEFAELKFEQLYQMFSNFSRETVDLILDLTSYDSAKTVEILLGGIKPHDVLEQLSLQLLKKDSITLSVDDQSAIGDAIAYYKKRDVDLTHPLRIKYSAGLDAGGLSRQFYSDVMLHIKDKMNAFEGPVATCLIPAYSSQVLASGILKILGRIVVHSLLQGGPGFPFLAPYVYRYITTESIDQAFEEVTLAVLPIPVANMIYALVNAKTEQDIETVTSDEEFIRLQTETSSVRLPSVTNKHAIAHEFILHEALVRRIAVLTQFCSGLQTLNFLEILRQIPDTFRPLFVYEEAQNVSDIIISCLSFPTVMSARQEAVGSLLRKYLGDSSELGLSKFLRFCTGSSYLPPPGYRDRLITVKFDDQAPGVATSTCINDIVLPTTPEIVDNEEMFAAMMEAVQSDNGKPFNCL